VCKKSDENIVKIKEDLSQVKISLDNLSEENVKNTNSIVNNVTKIKAEVSSTAKPLTMAEIVKLKKSVHELPETKVIEKKRNEYVLFVKGIDEKIFKTPQNFKKTVSDFFPHKKIIKCYRKKNNIVDIVFQNEEDMKHVEINWKNCIEGSSVISLESIKNKALSNKTAILRDVPFDLSESELLNNLKDVYDSVEKIDRFIKGGKAMPIVKISFSNDMEHKDLIEKGFFINNIFLPAENLIESRRPLRCFNCFRMNHHSDSCKGKKLCKNCSGEYHDNGVCSQVSKCINCSGNHSSADKVCPMYQQQLKRINNIE